MIEIRPVDANALVEYMCGHCGASCNLEDECCADVDAVKKASTINPDDLRPHGCWEEWWPGISIIMTGEEMLYRCSECGSKWGNVEGYRYCPYCGAMMDGKEQGNDNT